MKVYKWIGSSMVMHNQIKDYFMQYLASFHGKNEESLYWYVDLCYMS